jgi:integrase
VKPLPIGEHEPWPADVLEKALAAASPMTRLSIILGLCTGARRGDAIRLQHAWHDGQTLQYTAAKNKTDVAIPVHPLLLEELAKAPKRALTMLYGRDGAPFKRPDALSDRIRALMQSIGEGDYSYHGLRKNAACYLKEMGLEDTQIGSMLAMTPDTVRHYTKRSRAYMIARKAATKVTRGDVLQLKVGRRERTP